MSLIVSNCAKYVYMLLVLVMATFRFCFDLVRFLHANVYYMASTHDLISMKIIYCKANTNKYTKNIYNNNTLNRE